MDEYLNDDQTWVSKDHPLSFRGFMDRQVLHRIDPELVMLSRSGFSGSSKFILYSRADRKAGRRDICFGGIGINGHVASNEGQIQVLVSRNFWLRRQRVLEITKETRTANAIGDFGGALEDMPHDCVTIDGEIAHARKIRLGCFKKLAQSCGKTRGLW